jgi:hypothetical protein
MSSLKRRNLSGIYTMYKFEDEPLAMPTCFEDCPQSHQVQLMREISHEELMSLAINLAKELRKVGDQFEIQTA